ncbi:hypothetical protein B296_00003117 [Ensete ventricosum]|uniref:Uncharacterized protein n=1 Tax=Ensete ventricosum TaxID=4639 RepID=A0A427AWY5_ENSVE|nr:hypothetical protein B296_00003117 [Ensete ventricosum]
MERLLRSSLRLEHLFLESVPRLLHFQVGASDSSSLGLAVEAFAQRSHPDMGVRHSPFDDKSSYSRSKSVAMFRGELIILGRRTLFGWPPWTKFSSLRVYHFVPHLALW